MFRNTQPLTVKAQQYMTKIFNDADDFVHGEGRDIIETFVPSHKIIINENGVYESDKPNNTYNASFFEKVTSGITDIQLSVDFVAKAQNFCKKNEVLKTFKAYLKPGIDFKDVDKVAQVLTGRSLVHDLENLEAFLKSDPDFKVAITRPKLYNNTATISVNTKKIDFSKVIAATEGFLDSSKPAALKK